MAKLGKFNIFVENESPSYGVESTSYPVEKGIAFTDHVKRQPRTLSVSGYLFGNYKKTLSELEKAMNKGEIMTYAGRFVMTNCIIEGFDPGANAEISNGFSITIKLKQIRIVKSPYIKKKGKKKVVIKPKTNNGRKKVTERKPSPAVYHIVKKGEYRWIWAKKYNTTVDTITKLNPQIKDWLSIKTGTKVMVK